MNTKQNESDLLGKGNRTPIRNNVRDQIREPMREARGGLVVQGHNGEQLSRKRKDDGTDPFFIPPDLIPPGWSYQWVAQSVKGSQDEVADHNLMLYENGWRAVPADRHPGRFMPVGHKGNIIRGAQMLMERPKALTDEANAEMVEKARQQMMDRDEALMGNKAALRQAMRNGMEMGGKYRGTGGSLKMSIDPALDIPAPSHPLAEPGE